MKETFHGMVLALTAAASAAALLSPRSASAAPPTPPSGYEVIDLITNHDYEDPSASTGFETFSGTTLEGTVTHTTVNPVAGTGSAELGINAYGRILNYHDLGWQSGRFADIVAFDAKVRVEGSASGNGNVQVCAIVYFQDSSEPGSTCQTLPADPQDVVDVSLVVDTGDREVRSAFAQFTHANDNATIRVLVEDAHLYIVQRLGGGSGGGETPPPPPPPPPGGGGETPPPPPPPNGGMGEHPSSQNGRHVTMISPSDGETFVTPLSLRLVASGYDNLVFTNDPVEGKGQNAAKVEWYLDNTLIHEQYGADAEYRVFKGFANNLNIPPGTYRVWARAIYVNPSLVLDSQPFTIKVQAAPSYATTIDLTQDIVLSASNPGYQLDGTNGRIRLNGNCHAITGTGELTLRHVDVYNLGSCTDTAAPGIDVTSFDAVTIEDVTFDDANRLALTLQGTAVASIRGNTVHSNMRMPIGQQPFAPSTYPVITLAGTSTAQKVFAGNRIGAGPVHIDLANNWLLGGSTDADGNILIGPRTAFVIDESSNITVRGNFLHHVYDGGWSQGELFEVHGTSPLLVEHNIFRGSSWPVRGLAGEFRYNLVANGGHTWVIPEANAYIHHNVFVACYDDGVGCNMGGIAGQYDVDNIRIENNTFDGVGSLMRAAVAMDKGSATIRSNAFFNVMEGSDTATVDIVPGASVDANYNGFYRTRSTNYADGRTPINDLADGVQTNPQFFAAPAAVTFDERALWTGDLSVSDVLFAYRALYTPTQGSLYIDVGDSSGGAGNDIGAVGAGMVNADDQFGSFTSADWTPPPTPAPGAGTNANQAPEPDTLYRGFTYNLPTTRPFVSMADFTSVDTASQKYLRFKSWVDQAVFQNAPGYGYTSADAVVMYAISGDIAYLSHAIAGAEAQVAQAESDIAQGDRPSVSADSYLDAWHYMEQVALAYDYGYDHLTPEQRLRWRAYMQQTVNNIWNPYAASWGGKAFPWTGWAINDAGNNYFFGHVKATMYVALALQDRNWIGFLQTYKFPLIADYFANVPGGGTREGTGYGSAIGNLFDDFRLWRSSTGENLAVLSPHAKETLDYWIHATVPTRDRFAPIGDQSRVSNPEIFDYQRNLMTTGLLLSQGTEQAGRAAWWLRNIDLRENTSGFTLRTSLLDTSDPAEAPSALSYYASGAGDFFVRSSWDEDALWLAVKAGTYDQSHAHMDQGSFTLHSRDWLAVTSSVWSHSGLQGVGNSGYLGTEVNNVLRFVANGNVVPQNFSESVMVQSIQNGITTVDADLTDAYSANASAVQGWTRELIFNAQDRTLRVVDACQVAADVDAIFQLHVPVQPVQQADGTITAGKLTIQPGSGMAVAFVDMTTVDPDFLSGWRIDITNPNGCIYDVSLTAQE